MYIDAYIRIVKILTLKRVNSCSFKITIFSFIYGCTIAKFTKKIERWHNNVAMHTITK
jgi:hypothetical protein